MNTCTIEGNLTRDPELRFTPNGKAVTNLGVAVNRRWKNAVSNEFEESVSFFDVTAWGELGQNCASSLNKGDRVIVSGRLEQRSWESDDKVKHSKVEIVADSVGPSLLWATVVVTRTPKQGTNGQASGYAGGVAQGQGQQQPAAAWGEEPF